MGVPATTGVERASITDMKIGDYIACKYVASSGAVGTFSELGTSTDTEIALTGSATPNGSFYFVKVAKGLIVADRVVQHTFTWDAMNTGKIVQGKPIDFGNIIPTMTSNTSPSGVASASSEYSSSLQAWKAFDGSSSSGSDCWISSNNVHTGWLQYEFSDPKNVTGYAITSRSGINRGDLKTWTFEGSNDGASWILLDSKVNEPVWNSSEKRVFPINNKGNYRYYRINIQEITLVGGGNYISIGELAMFDKPTGTIRSLTGGVAYADANGNKSLIQPNPSCGAWPTNNEYDKFLLGFPQELIQQGKTLDDVFHISSLNTWAQDTILSEEFYSNSGSSTKAASGLRVVRGNRNLKWEDFHFKWSQLTNIDAGFRPVFQYREE